MSTRKITCPLSIALWLLGTATACAGEFSMSGNLLAQVDTVDAARNVTMEPSSRSSLGADSSSMRGGAIIDTGMEESVSPRATVGSDPEASIGTAPTTPAAGVRIGIPAAVPAVPNRARNGNRWQSLVPGAIK